MILQIQSWSYKNICLSTSTTATCEVNDKFLMGAIKLYSTEIIPPFDIVMVCVSVGKI